MIGGCSAGTADPPPAADRSAPATSATPAPPSATDATATVGPGRGTGFFAGSMPEVPLTFTMPAGWEVFEGWAVSKSGADPVFGLVFMDVANIYADGCRWELVDPPPAGKSVDDLVAAYARAPELEATPAREVTLGGFAGQYIQTTVPEYEEGECTEGRFGIFQLAGSSGGPNLWAQAPGQKNQHWILDVDGNRLVVLAGDSGNMSAQDRTDLEGILGSLRIG